MNRVKALIAAYAPRDAQEAADRRQMLAFMDMCDDFLTRGNTVAHITASSWIVDPARTMALMIYHNIYDSWTWTGGHADGEGDLLSVALREAQEETGIRARAVIPQPASIESIGVKSHIKRGAVVSAHVHMNVTFLLEADPKADIRVKPDENSGVRWIAFEDIAQAVSEPEMLPIFSKLISRAREY